MAVPGSAHAAATQERGKIDPELEAVMASAPPGQMLAVIVTLRAQADLTQFKGPDRAARQQAVIHALQATAAAGQRPLRAVLAVHQAQGRAGPPVSLWVFDGLSVTATPDVIAELAARDDVLKITPDSADIVPAVLPEPNLAVVNAAALWSQVPVAVRGQGVVVASLDSGVDASHPDLASRWRGGSNSWYDPYGQHPAVPIDLTGHGTWTMGIMVGGDAGGTSIGVAPDAQWIAARIWDDAGRSTATGIHQSFQWLLDPDGNPATPDAPNVVNNSWSYGAPGCNLEFQLDLQALRALGILPVFAAGNYGPNVATSVSPANYPEAFAVGAVDNAGAIYAYSSRGPSACGEAQTVYPELVAPGVAIRTADLSGSYAQATGTSLAAPHVAGTLALLLGAFPDLSVSRQEAALRSGALDLGAAGPDNDYGYGRLDALAAYILIQDGGIPTPTPVPTPDPTPTPVPTFHIGDIDGAAVTTKSGWTATVTLTAHDRGHTPLSSVNVSGTWGGAYTGTASCTTGSAGTCRLQTGVLAKKAARVVFTVTAATHPSLLYDATANHDADGDGDGTTITVSKP